MEGGLGDKDPYRFAWVNILPPPFNARTTTILELDNKLTHYNI